MDDKAQGPNLYEREMKLQVFLESHMNGMNRIVHLLQQSSLLHFSTEAMGEG